MNGAELFVQCLENEGVEYIFGIPGEENLDFLEALRTSSIKLILTRHEQAAGFMAATFGRLTGKPGVCLSTLGPGATNFVTSSSFALLGGMPVLFITGQKPIKKSKQGRFQIIDVVRIMEPITKFTRQIVNANNIPSLVRETFRLAMEEKPGPVHLELPEDIAAENADEKPYSVTEIHRTAAAKSAIIKASEIISSASHPLLLIAAGANRKEICHELYEFIDKTGIYFFSTQMGKGVLDERHPRCLGTAALSDHDYLHCAISSADVIINVGHDVVEKPPFFMTPEGFTVIHINYYSANVDAVYFPQHEVVGDIAETIKELASVIEPCTCNDFSYFERIKIEIETNVFAGNDDDSFPVKPQYIVSEIRKIMPGDGIISLDNGMFKLWFARNYKAYESNTVLLDNALATMGAGLPAAIAAKIIYPDRKIVAICGDGGFMMNSQELETAIRLGLNLVVIILRDDAKSYNATGHRITKASELSPLTEKCLESPGVHLIEVPVDYMENEKVFIDELKSKTCIL
ncbi:MAG: acetolactate synthase large subunit [Deltaproteobacteria bacterium]|nr:acetolactate synthase large subunit [Deltaproteobacteria bacterium]